MLGRLKGWIAGWTGGFAADSEVVRMVADFNQEAGGREFWSAGELDILSMGSGQRILNAPPEERVRILVAAFHALCRVNNSSNSWWGTGRISNERALRHLVSRLLRARLPLGSDDLRSMLRATPLVRYLGWLPLAGLMRAVEQFAETNVLDDRLIRELEALQRKANKSDYAEMAKIAGRIGSLLGGKEKKPTLARGPFGRQVKEWLKELDTPNRRKWQALIHHAGAPGTRNKPSAKWLKEAETLAAAVGEAEFAARLEGWLGALAVDPENPEPNTDLIKALIWMAILFQGDRLTAFLGRFCETCYKKVPGWGARSMKLGNACLYALGQMGERGVAELVRVRGRMKYVQARQQLEKALAGAAERAGLSVADLEEIALPDFGLGGDGSLTEMLGDATAKIRIEGSDEVTLSWTGADGKPRKSVPASVKEDHKDGLKELRARVKEIKGLLSGQRYRLESLYLRDRSWPLAQWRERYLEHPLLAGLTRRLIWNIGEVAAIPAGDGFVGADGKPFEPSAEVTVSLWHPIGVVADGVLAWRRRLAEMEITQPFKQAYREIYLLTDAERETGTYSNRFAAHILRQHQFAALCSARQWRYTLQGDWDSHNFPYRELEDRDLTILFDVEPANTEDKSEMGIFNHLATDRVFFRNNDGGELELTDLLPLQFSELMRDVDLFVGVASIGNDPEWVDRGPDAPFIDYWRSYSVAELTESAKTRRAVLKELLPRLKIADVCELEERFLKVRGNKRTYRIHLGSGNIQMEPNNQYLCIVPGVGAVGGDKVRLPFEGDGVLSIILSKAFLLAADDKIPDKTILSQIGR